MLDIEFEVGKGYFAALGLDVREGFQNVRHGLVAQAKVVQFGELAVRLAVGMEQAAAVGRDVALGSEIGAVAQ